MKLVLLVRSTVGATEWFPLKITMVSDLIYISTIFDEFFELYINRLKRFNLSVVGNHTLFIEISNSSHRIALISSSL